MVSIWLGEHRLWVALLLSVALDHLGILVLWLVLYQSHLAASLVLSVKLRTYMRIVVRSKTRLRLCDQVRRPLQGASLEHAVLALGRIGALTLVTHLWVVESMNLIRVVLLTLLHTDVWF